MESREKYLSELREYIDKVESEVTIILQSLQWSRVTLLKPIQTGTCKYDCNHIIPVEKINEHEKICYLKSKGYSKEDLFLPEPLDPAAPTVVKLTTENINDILENAAKSDPLFKRGTRNESEPLTLARLQATYTADERRAIHDAVVNMVPSSHDLVDLTLASDQKGSKEVQKSREQILAELRDTKRRRPRYRGAPQRNYSHELRQVIASQMELYTDAHEKLKDDSNENNDQQHSSRSNQEYSNQHSSRDRRDQYKERKPDVREERSRGREERSYLREERSYGREERSYGREERNGGRLKREHSVGSKRDSYDNKRRRDDHYERKHQDKYERDGYSSSSRNGKRRHEDDHNDYKVRSDYDRYDRRRSYDKYEKYTHKKVRK